MPITLLDIVLLAVMLLSGLLAMVRGFMREILSIAAWAVAAIATLTLYQRLLPTVKQYFTSDLIATAATIGGIFVITLIIASIITVRISDMVLDSRIGALDRTLGFIFGLARGLLIVVVAFLFFIWLVPEGSQPSWVAGAKSREVLDGTGKWLLSLLPDDPENTILKRLKKSKPEDDDSAPDAAPDAAPDQRTELAPANGQKTTPGYSGRDRAGLQHLIDNQATR